MLRSPPRLRRHVRAFSFLLAALIAVMATGSRCWSAAARLRRHDRAVERGFLRLGAVEGKVFLEVERPAARLVKAMARGKELHMKIDSALGVQHHFLRHSVLETRPLLNEAVVERRRASQGGDGP